MPPKKPHHQIKPGRNEVLPMDIHLWREKRWPVIEKIEATQGDGRRASQQIRNISEITKKRLAEGKVTPLRLKSAARAVQKLAARITDEVIKRMDEHGIQHESWNNLYWNCLSHFRNVIPDVVRHEIMFQVRKIPEPDPRSKKHYENISRLIKSSHSSNVKK